MRCGTLLGNLWESLIVGPSALSSPNEGGQWRLHSILGSKSSTKEAAKNPPNCRHRHRGPLVDGQHRHALLFRKELVDQLGLSLQRKGGLRAPAQVGVSELFVRVLCILLLPLWPVVAAFPTPA